MPRRFLSYARQQEEAVCLFIYLDADKSLLLSVSTLISTLTETTFPKIWAKPIPKNAKIPLLVNARRSKTSLLLIVWIKAKS